MTRQAELAQTLEYIKFAFSEQKYDDVIRLCNKALNTELSDHHYLGLIYSKALAYKEKNECQLGLNELNRGFSKVKNIFISRYLHEASARGLRQRKAYYRSLYFSLQSNLYASLDGCLSERALTALYNCNYYCLGQRDPGVKIEHNVSSIFDVYSKEGVFKAIRALPDKALKISFLKTCLNSETLLGQQFYQQRGVKACQPGKGVLESISKHLKKLTFWGPTRWQEEGNQAFMAKDYSLALEAYKEAEEVCFLQDTAKIKLHCGNLSLLMGDYAGAYAYCEAILNQEPPTSVYYMDALINRVNTMSYDPAFSIIDVIQRLEEIHLLSVMESGELNDEQKEMLDKGVAALFAKHSKLTIFEAIKTLEEEQVKSLLTKCLEKDHYLGKHFWKNRIPGTNCELRKGTLNKIKSYLDELNGCLDALPSSPFSLLSVFSRASVSKESTEMSVLSNKG